MLPLSDVLCFVSGPWSTVEVGGMAAGGRSSLVLHLPGLCPGSAAAGALLSSACLAREHLAVGVGFRRALLSLTELCISDLRA